MERLYNCNKQTLGNILVAKKWKEYDLSIDTSIRNICPYYDYRYAEFVNYMNINKMSIQSDEASALMKKRGCVSEQCHNARIQYNTFLNHPWHISFIKPTYDYFNNTKLKFEFNNIYAKKNRNVIHELTDFMSSVVSKKQIWVNMKCFNEYINIEGDYIIHKYDTTEHLYYSPKDNLTLNNTPVSYIYIIYKNTHNNRSPCALIYFTFNMNKYCEIINTMLKLGRNRKNRISLLPKEIIRHIIYYV